MTIEEAIKDIKENIKPCCGGKSLDMAIEALKKQIPKKAIYNNPYGNRDSCPRCDELINYRIDNYCHRCGQLIDWSVEE